MEPFISHGFLIFQLLYFSPAEKTVSSSHLQLLLERSSVFLKLCFQISPVPVPADYPIPLSTLSEIGVSFETSKLRLELISADVSCRPFAMHISQAVVLLVQKSAVAMSIKSFSRAGYYSPSHIPSTKYALSSSLVNPSSLPPVVSMQLALLLLPNTLSRQSSTNHLPEQTCSSGYLCRSKSFRVACS